MLNVARKVCGRGLPVLGINLGQLGFLTETDISGCMKYINKALSGRLCVENRIMLEASPRGMKKYLALNDVVVKNGRTARVIELRLEINGKFVADYVADGLIVSTPTGSTAYSLAAGGPIVSPQIPVFVITPICPHTLTFRPLMVSSDDKITIRVKSNHNEVILTMDGQDSLPLKKGDEVTIKRSVNHFKLLTDSGRDFYGVLRAKLKWGER